jgi:hypothetical protein
MKEFGIVFDHYEGEYSVYARVENELNAWNAIEFYRKEGRNVELFILSNADVVQSPRIPQNWQRRALNWG